MVIEVDGPIGSKQGVKICSTKRMRVIPLMFKDKKVGDVHDSDPGRRNVFAKPGGSFDDFESDFGTNTHKNDIRIKTTVGRCKLPNRGPGAAVRVCLFSGKKNRLRLL